MCQFPHGVQRDIFQVLPVLQLEELKSLDRKPPGTLEAMIETFLRTDLL